MGDFLTKQKLLLAKEESVYGTDPTPTVGDNAIDASDIKINYVGDVLDRNLMRDNLSPTNPVIGKRYIEISFNCEIKGSGSAGTAPALGDLLEACGLTESVSAGSSVTYTPSANTMKSVTFYLYDVSIGSGSSRMHEINGARGNVNFVMEAGQIARAEFSFQGLYNIPVDCSAPSTPTFESTLPPVVNSASFTLNSVSLVAQAVSIDMGNEVSQSENVSATTGISSFQIVGRKPVGQFNPEAVLLATYDFWSDWTGATKRALSIAVGATAGNICTITAPKVTLDALSEGELNGIMTADIPFHLGVNSGNDEIQLKFT